MYSQPVPQRGQSKWRNATKWEIAEKTGMTARSHGAWGAGGDGSMTASATRKRRLGAGPRRRSCGWPLRGNSRDSRLPAPHFLFCMLKLKHSPAETKNGPQQIIDFFFSVLGRCISAASVAKAETTLLFSSENLNHGWTDARDTGRGF